MPESSNSSKLKTKKEEITLNDIFRTINNRKYILFISVILLLALAFTYNKITKPVYEASVLLKKDKTSQDKSEKEDLKDIVLLQSPDEIETEMEIVKTREVLDKVADELMLPLSIDKIVYPEGKTKNLNISAIEYKRYNSRSLQSGMLPSFIKVKLNPSRVKYNLYIKKIDSLNFALYNSQNDSLLQTSRILAAPAVKLDDSLNLAKTDNIPGSGKAEDNTAPVQSFATFELAGANIAFNWPLAAKGSTVYFNLDSYFDTIENLNKNLKVEHVVKTDIFQITVQSASPYAAQKIANTIAEKFREIRINQQKQNIRYSFNFVDKQLQDVWGKLKNAEGELSKYKSASQITSIDESSKSLVDFLSNLEAEKIKTNLELTENEDKLSQMKNELKSKGYIDETYLTPHTTEQSGSPFSNLLRQLSDLEVQRIELLQKRKESHPEVVAIDQRIKQIKDKLTAYNQNTLTAYQIIINSAKKKQTELNDLTAKYGNKIEALPPKESHLAELLRQKNVYDKIFTLLLNQREEMRMAELSKLQDIMIVDQAHEPVKPVSPKEPLNLALGLLAGIFLGFTGIIIKELRDKKLITLDEVENNIDIPIYAIIPNYPKEIRRRIKNAKKLRDSFVTMMTDQDGFRESYRVLKTKLESKLQINNKILMFTSCEENTGKTSVISNLAVSLAHSNRRVLIVDFDLKKASLTKMFNIDMNKPGMVKFLTQDVKTPEIYSLTLSEKGEGYSTLHILPAGGISEASGDMINQEKMNKLMGYLKSLFFDYILIDTPPITRVADVLAIGRFIKNTFLVIRPEWTFRDSVQWGLQEMEQENINILGIVINACDIKRSTFRYRYGYGYGYNYGERPA